MAGGISSLLKTPESKARLRKFSAVVFALIALLSWWAVYTDGASPARVLIAVASTAVAVLEVLFPGRRGLVRRPAQDPGSPDDKSQEQGR